MNNIGKELDTIPAPGRKNDTGKLRYDLLDPFIMEEIVKVLTHGAEVYGDRNWMTVDNAAERYYAAGQRHQSAWRKAQLGKGNVLDSEASGTGCHHGACAIVNLMFGMILERKANQGNHDNLVDEIDKAFRGK